METGYAWGSFQLIQKAEFALELIKLGKKTGKK